MKAHFKNKKKSHLVTNKLVIISIIVITFFSTFNFINKRLTNHMTIFINESIDKLNNTIFTNYIDRHLLNEVNLNNIISLMKNADGEIIGVDYNLENAYKVLSLATIRVKEGIESLEVGDLAKIDDFYKDGYKYDNNYIIMVPLGIISNSILFNRLGPKIPIRIGLMQNILNSISTKVENYGINNVLIEIYMNFNVTTNILTPIKKEAYNHEYKILIGSVIVNGKVPGYLGLVEQNSPMIEN